MVSGINGNFSLNSLNSIQSELRFASIDNFGNIPDNEISGLSTETANAVNLFGSNKEIASKKISTLILDKTKQPDKTSKEAAPDMDLSLDDDDIPSPPKV